MGDIKIMNWSINEDENKIDNLHFVLKDYEYVENRMINYTISVENHTIGKSIDITIDGGTFTLSSLIADNHLFQPISKNKIFTFKNVPSYNINENVARMLVLKLGFSGDVNYANNPEQAFAMTLFKANKTMITKYLLKDNIQILSQFDKSFDYYVKECEKNIKIY